jgi:NAD+ dependent glucose-6-phosphate dehydrogenase
MAKRRVLITGAGGNIGTMLLERLADRFEIVALDLEAGEGPNGIRIREADIRSLDALVPHMEGIDTIVHLAGDPSTRATWESVYELNIGGTRNVLEAARQQGVRRVVFASSNHAMGMYDRDSEWPVYNHLPPRPDSLYGVSKVFGETIGRFYHDEYGLEFIALRIGWSTDDISDGDAELLHAMWLSPDDTAEVVGCAVDADVPFGIYYAVSDNPNRRWDLTDTMVDLGYRPKDRWDDALRASENIVDGGQEADPAWPNPD